MQIETPILEEVNSIHKFIVNESTTLLENLGLSGESLIIARSASILIITVLFSMFVWWLSRKIMITTLHQFIIRSKTKWDDYLVEKRFFAAVAHIAPLFFMDFFVKIIFFDYPIILKFLLQAINVLFVAILLVAILRFLSAFEKILSEKPKLKDKPIQSYFQLIKILVSGFMIILGLSISTGQSPVYFLTSLGAATAIILLIFKDTILGFVGSIQLAANDMVRIGDWVTMEKYGADGDVTEITLNTVKVQNFDKTITTIPTYAFISDSFKNWRGMELSEGRRIKRSINIEMSSIKFCTPEMLNELQKITLISDYIDGKEKEINDYNTKNNLNKDDFLLNGRHQTNIGLYRQYILAYLRSNTNINPDMTTMVRQLPPTAMGVPLEIYCFSKQKDWVIYESIMSDLFDHLFAATSYFDLVIFEQPSGRDITETIKGLKP